MKTRTIVPIALTVAAVALFGCSNNEGMGRDMMPDADKPNNKIETIEVKAYTEAENSVNSSNMSYMLLGKFSDPIFGETETSFAAKFSNSSYGTYSAGDICDSLVLTVGVDTTDTFFYGVGTTPVTVDVYCVTEQLFDSVKYQNNYNLKYDEVKIASTTFKPCEIDSMITFKFKDNEATLRQYGQKIINHALTTSFDQNICGLYFKVSDGNSITKFQRGNNYTQYIVYHHVPNKDTVSSSVIYSIQSTDCSINLSSHDYTGTQLENVTSSASGSQGDYLYLQSMTGTRIRIDITGLDQIYDKMKPDNYFTIRGAYIEAPLADKEESNQKDFPAIDNVVCVGSDKANTVYNDNDSVYYDYSTDSYRMTNDSSLYFNDFVINMTGTPSLNILSRDTTNNCYRLNMTGRVVNLLKRMKNGETGTYSIYLYPSSRTTDFNRSVICSPENGKTPMRLIVEYAYYDM